MVGEGFGHFVTELRHLPSTCEFGDREDERIRDRIVLEITDDKVQEKRLREKKITLESAQEIVLTSEVFENLKPLLTSPPVLGC